MIVSLAADASASSDKEHSRLTRLFDRLQSVHPDLTVLQMGILLRVAEKPGISMKAISQDMNVSSAHLAEAVTYLCACNHTGVAGPDLILVRINQLNLQERGLSLTIKGKQLIREILAGA
jgi:DNA-binding MarR family transcriptional regulator